MQKFHIHKTAKTVFLKAVGTLGLAAVTQVMIVPTAIAEPAEARQFSSKTGAIVSEALPLIEAGDHPDALAKLDMALTQSGLTAYERSMVHQMRGASYYELNDYGRAVAAFRAAIEAGGLLPGETSALHVNIAQLLIVDGNFTEGAQMLEGWVAQGGDVKYAHIEMLTQAWVQAEDYNKALPWAKRWFEMSQPPERKHYDLLNFLYSHLKQPAEQALTVRLMVKRWPEDRALWDALISLLSQTGQEAEAFEITKMLYFDGLLTREAELMKLVQYYSYYDIPYEAAQIMEHELEVGGISRRADTLVQLSDLYRQAREYERAIPFLEDAAKLSGTAKPYANLGEAYYKQGQCDKTEVAFMRAIDLGYDAGKSYMLIATCRYESSQAEDRPSCDISAGERLKTPKYLKRASAKSAFEKVSTTSSEHKNAVKWISYIDAEAAALERGCIFKDKVYGDQCFLQIKGAYAQQIFTGQFEVDDENCMRFKPAYDTEYRMSVEYLLEQ